ncbi:MAG TPA: 3-hydroxyacyl-CoA dehydrogenase, partial [Aliiroseovarius sp.]|nr:3-hydroxyacyl-CoA dehydrogenase [Aliiroseovarius sp.]
PPVNALGAEVRRALSQQLARAEQDDAVSAIVISAAGRTFPVGADVREFGQPPVDPILTELCNQIEAAHKPVVAALHGSVLGGGLEIALAAHYRIADHGTKLGLPEVTLGILPGAGGTQRTPRLAGAKAALDLMLTGKPISADKAAQIGLIDRVVSENVDTAAGIWAQDLAENGAGPRPTAAIRTGLEDGAGFVSAVEAAREKVRNSPVPAPSRIVDCVEAAILVPFETGLAMERAAFEHCVATDQARALRHAFFAERLAAKVPELARAKPRPVNSLGVVGAGLMGAGIAYTALNAGFPVTLIERDADALRAGEGRVRGLYTSAVSKGRMSEAEAQDKLAHLTLSTDMTALGPVDAVIEAVFEEESVKRDVFAALDQVMKPGAILASNTSYLDIDMLAATISRPEDVVGFHFFSPAHIMKLMEVVVGARTDDDVTATGFALAKRLGKIPVRAGVCDGFIGNRILTAYRNAADFMLEDGVSPYDIDAAMRAYGFGLGPYQVLDMAGLGISWARRKRLAATRDPNARYVRIGDLLCEAGRMGQKTGRGYYRYDEGNRRGRPDPEVLALIDRERAAKGIRPRAFSTEEIQARCVGAMTNEGARILQEGIALRPSDIDVVMLHGYGFPRWRGGPMMAADLSGLLQIRNALAGWAAEEGAFWAPSPLFDELIKNGRHFADLT